MNSADSTTSLKVTAERNENSRITNGTSVNRPAKLIALALAVTVTLLIVASAASSRIIALLGAAL
jgi:hypothetical protein